MKPDARQHHPTPDYLRSLVERAGLSQREAARRIGIGPRSMRHYLTGQRVAPYSVQFALERLADGKDPS
jgi:transcriptional regulator with XRE-family HTH domain